MITTTSYLALIILTINFGWSLGTHIAFWNDVFQAMKEYTGLDKYNVLNCSKCMSFWSAFIFWTAMIMNKYYTTSSISDLIVMMMVGFTISNIAAVIGDYCERKLTQIF